ncbi:MAG: T9SS C-terminal target domain-containing protein, partial [Saprospirales bacterium]
MKNTILLTLILFLSGSIFSQTQGDQVVVVGTCTQLTITAVPEYEECYVYQGSGTFCPGGVPCCNMALTPYFQATPRYQLQKLNSSGTWDDIGSYQYSPVFISLSQGTYRVEATLPQIRNDCQVQTEEFPYYEFHPWELRNLQQQFIGYLATWDGSVYPYHPPIIHYSDPVIVGPTNSNDLDWVFIQSPGFGFNAFDEGQQVDVDASASKNYNMWYLAISEQGGPNRWFGNGWSYGDIDDPLEITDYWYPWNLRAFRTYKVQIAIENRQCRNGIEWPGTSWTVLEKTFFVCPVGTGCRFVMDREMKQLQLYPNPTTNYVNLDNYEPHIHGTLDLKVYDMSGRLMMNSKIH